MGVSSPHTAVTRPGRFKIQWWWGVVILLTQVITIMKRVQIMQFFKKIFSWKLVEHQRFFVYSQSSAKIPHRMRSWSVCSEAQFHYKNTVKCMIEHQKHIRDEDARFFSCLKACVRGDFYCEPAGKEWHYLRIKISFCIYDASTPPGGPPKIFVKT